MGFRNYFQNALLKKLLPGRTLKEATSRTYFGRNYFQNVHLKKLLPERTLEGTTSIKCSYRL
jgi:hypothetical protein